MGTASPSGDVLNTASLSSQPQPHLPRWHLLLGSCEPGREAVGILHPLAPGAHHVIRLLRLCRPHPAIIPPGVSFLWVSTACRKHTRPKGRSS